MDYTGEILALWLMVALFALVPAKVAANKGRSAVRWFLLSFLITPFFSLILVVLMSNLKQKKERHAE